VSAGSDVTVSDGVLLGVEGLVARIAVGRADGGTTATCDCDGSQCESYDDLLHDLPSR
jgi:hypothetical protein